MNSKLYGPERAGNPQLGVRPVPTRLPVLVDGNPVRMRLPHLIARRVRVGARDDVHAHRAASRHERAERIAVAKPGAAMVQRHLRRIVGDDSAGAQCGGVGMQPVESSRARTADRNVRDRFRPARAAPSASAGRTSPPARRPRGPHCPRATSHAEIAGCQPCADADDRSGSCRVSEEVAARQRVGHGRILMATARTCRTIARSRTRRTCTSTPTVLDCSARCCRNPRLPATCRAKTSSRSSRTSSPGSTACGTR